MLKSKPIEFKSNLLFWPTIFLIFSAALFLRLHDRHVQKRSADEPLYTAYSNVVAHQGVSMTKLSVGLYNSTPKLWKFPPPTRVGYLYPTALWMKMRDRFDMPWVARFSFFTGGLALALLAFIGFRFFGRGPALAALLMAAASPFAIEITRRAWEESLTMLVGAVLSWLTLEILVRRRRWALMLYVLAGFYALTLKESGIAAAGLALSILIIFLLVKRRWREALFLGFGFALACGAFFFLITTVSGGWQACRDIFVHIRDSIAANYYAVHSQDGSFWTLWKIAWLASPWATGFFLLGAGRAARGLFKKDANAEAAFFLAAFFIANAVLISVPRYFINLRYLSVAYAGFFLTAGCGLVWLAEIALRRHKALFAGLCLLAVLAAGADYLNFRKIFVDGSTVDFILKPIERYSIYSWRAASLEGDEESVVARAPGL